MQTMLCAAAPWGFAAARLLVLGVLFAVFTALFVRRNGLACLCGSFLSLFGLCLAVFFLMAQEALAPCASVGVTVCVGVLTAEIRRYTARREQNAVPED